MKSIKILVELKEKIKKIIKELNVLKEKKREEIREINKIEQKFACLDKILASDLPVNEETISIFEAVSASGDFVSDKLLDLFEASVFNEQAIFATTNTASSAMLTFSTSISNIHISPKIKQNILELTSEYREKERQKIVSFLKVVSPHLVDIYQNANENLDMVSVEPERSAAGLMREVVDQVLDILAKDEEIKSQAWFVPDKSSRSGVTRAHRLRYIAESKTLDNKTEELIKENAGLFIITVKNLNKSFHKRKKLDAEESKSFFYQAETLLKILSNSIKI
jgi:hypothetical protein